MQPRNAILAVVIASTGSFVAGQIVQAQVDKNTVFQPIGLTSLDRACLVYEVLQSPIMLDGGFNADGGWIDGGWGGLYTRTLGPNVAVLASSTLLPKVPFTNPELCTTSSVVPRGSFPAVDEALRTAVVPALSAGCHIAMTDGGY
jgi:hypothetical protein